MNIKSNCGGKRRTGLQGRGWQASLVLALALLVGGCGAKLRPAPMVRTLPDDKKAAVAEADGVRMVVKGDDWSGNPSNLEQVITAMHVSANNGSSQPLRLRYNDFKLRGENGVTYYALPPYKIEGSVTTAAPAPYFVPRFAHSGFYVAPYYHRFYGGLRPWGSPWAFDSAYYNNYYTYWRVPLPTNDMLEMAIPEGVIEPNGHVDGYLYFQKLDKNLKHVTFVAELMNAQSGSDFGQISLPFVKK